MLRQHSTTRLQYTVACLTFSEQGATSGDITELSRPDLLVVANAATLFVGVDKQTSLMEAMEDLVPQLAGGFSRQHYGPVQLYLAYTAAMPHFQLHSVDSAGQVRYISLWGAVPPQVSSNRQSAFAPVQDVGTICCRFRPLSSAGVSSLLNLACLQMAAGCLDHCPFMHSVICADSWARIACVCQPDMTLGACVLVACDEEHQQDSQG